MHRLYSKSTLNTDYCHREQSACAREAGYGDSLFIFFLWV